MKVIGAGFGRTGTSSLKAALEQLGFGPCHHMEELFAHHEQIPRWLAVAEGAPPDWDMLFAGYNSAVDFPTEHWYREILAHWPDARVILTVRDPEAWYRSARDTIYAISEEIPSRWVGSYLPVVGGVMRMTSRSIWRGAFGGRFLDREHAMAVFRAHNAEVKAHVPSEQLLVFDVSEGWEPLCRFLGVPVPATPFPRRNDSAEFRKRVLGTKILSWMVIGLPLLAIAAGSWWALR